MQHTEAGAGNIDASMQLIEAATAETASLPRDAVRSAITDAMDIFFQVRALLSVARLAAENLSDDSSCLNSKGMKGRDVVERTLRCAEEQADYLLDALDAAEAALMAH